MLRWHATTECQLDMSTWQTAFALVLDPGPRF
jgi:hypothetical protein